MVCLGVLNVRRMLLFEALTLLFLFGVFRTLIEMSGMYVLEIREGRGSVSEYLEALRVRTLPHVSKLNGRRFYITKKSVQKWLLSLSLSLSLS